MRPRRPTKPNLDARVEAWAGRLTLFRALRTILGVALVLVAVAGGLERLIEPEVFTSLGLAYWWAATTVTTVGYGDVVPQSVGGRIIAVGLMLVGFSLIPLLGGMIVSILVSKRGEAQREQIEQERREHMAALRQIEGRLEEIERATDDDS